MSESNNYEDEISLKELLMTIWNGRKLIAIITIIALLLTSVYTFGVADEQYEATSELIIRTPSAVTTRYGTYTFPSDNINDYIQYIYSNDVIDAVIKQFELDTTRAALKERITIKQEKDQNSFQVVVTDTKPETAQAINNYLVDEYMTQIRIAYKKNALNTFLQDYEVNMENIQNNILKQEALIVENQILLDSLKPIYTLQKSLFEDPETAAIYADTFNLDLSTLSDNVMVEEYANDNYFKVETQLIDLQTGLISLKEELSNQQMLYADLQSEQTIVAAASPATDKDIILDGKLDVMDSNVSVISYAYVPEGAVSPNKVLNLAIGLILGLLVGIFTVLFKSYWNSDKA